MASAQTCNFDDRSLSKMTQREIDVDLCVDNQENEETRAGCDNENKDFDESRFKRDQFSNNATTHSIPVSAATNSKQSDDTCKEQAFEEDARQKNQVRDSEQKAGEYVCDDGSNTESPGMTSQDDDTADDTADDTDYVESAGDERIACIEEEYLQRISVLEQRHSELENVLERLTTAVECGLAKPREHSIEVEEVSLGSEEDDQEKSPVAEGEAKETEAEKTERGISRSLIIDLFVEFQRKIRDFAQDLNGVLNCSEAAIRHARVVQEWATSVQLMFEQLKEERHKILGYIDERERNMLIVKEQFIAELEEQGKTLKQLVEEMMSHHELQQQGEEYCKTKVGETPNRRSTVEKIVDLLLKRRLEEDKSIILNLSKQSKISEMKLFIIHQQSCIQQLQEQNKELRAIIEGLMGPDDLEEEDPCDTDQTGTPASSTNLDQASLRDSLLRQESPTVSLVSDVLYCDRGEYLPGTSTDGDLATVRAYDIGRGCEEINSGEEIVFDPLSVNYVREQCQHAEETERQAHLEVNNPENEDQLRTVESEKPSDGLEANEHQSHDEQEVRQVLDDSDVISELPSKQDNVKPSENDAADGSIDDKANTKPSEDVGDGKTQLSDEKSKDNAAGDSVDVATDKGISSEQEKDLQVI